MLKAVMRYYLGSCRKINLLISVAITKLADFSVEDSREDAARNC